MPHPEPPVPSPEPPVPNPEPPLPNPDSPRPLGVLDEEKRWKIIALLTNGSSRRMAAKYVRCASSTITRTAARDPAFAEQIAVAEQNAEIDALRAVRNAARNQRYWRAAAWLLERRNPDDFARRPPNVITGDQLVHVFAQLTETLYQQLPEANWDRLLEILDELIESCRDEKNPLRPKPRRTTPNIPPMIPNSALTPVSAPDDSCCNTPLSDVSELQL